MTKVSHRSREVTLTSSNRQRGLVAAVLAALVAVTAAVEPAQAAGVEPTEPTVPLATTPVDPPTTPALTVTPPSTALPATPAPTTAAPPPAAPTPVTAAEPSVPTIQLPGSPYVGQTADSELEIQTTIDGAPVSLLVSSSSTVGTVYAGGAFIARHFIDSVAVTNAPASADVAALDFEQLTGTSFDQAYSRTGAPTERNVSSLNSRSPVLDAMSLVSVGFSSGPVSVGESWVFDGRIRSEGLTFEVTYQCRLAGVVDGTFTVDVSYAENFSADVNGGVVEGTVSGTGVFNGSTRNPLVLSGRLNQTINGATTIDGAATPMRRDTSVTVTSTAG